MIKIGTAKISSNRLKLYTGLVLVLLATFISPEIYLNTSLTPIEHRVIVIFVFAAVFWILEPIPIYATSMTIIVSLLLLVSDRGLNFMRTEGVGVLLPYQDIMATLASPIILLFLGGFFLAMGASKYGLDKYMAGMLLKPFGSNPRIVLLGIMSITALFSMFMSNTATTAMMLAILMTILSVFDPADKGRIAFALGIPLAANIGGIGTPIGTPPNAIALKYFTGTDVISFGSWMVFGVPFVLVMLFISWVLLLWLFPISIKSLTLDFRKGNIKSPQSRTVLITFFLTILLWLTDFLHGMNSYIVATIPVAVFLSAGIITREDLKKLSWDVLWLVSGGIALGYALDKSNLASNLISAIPFDTFPLLVLIVGAAFLAALMANFMSNTAAANLLLPLIAVIGTTLPGVEAIGGSKTMILSVALACSMGMVLPISTPPNALAHATGLFSTKEMARVGTIVGFIGLIVIFILMYLMNMIENL